MKTISVSQEIIKILIVDDQKIIRETLQLYLSSQSHLEVVDCAASGVIALEKIARLQPDVVVIDLEMPGMSGITTMEIISDRYPEIKAIVLSSHDEKDYINQAVTAGARGYFLKGTNPDTLITAIEKVHRGYFQLGTGLLDKLNLDSYGKTILEEEFTITDLEIPCIEEDFSDIPSSTPKKVVEDIEIPFIPTKLEVETKTQTEKTDDSQTEWQKMRRELIEIMEFKLHLVEEQKTRIQTKHEQLQKKFSWLLLSQVLLFFITIGCVSSLLRMQLEIARDRQDIRLTNTVQSVR